MSADAIIVCKSYVERGVQTGSPTSRARSPRLDARSPTSPFSDITSSSVNNAQQLSPSASSDRVSAYNHSLAHSSPPLSVVLRTQRVPKPPRLPRNRPSQHHSEATRFFSLPEDAPIVSSKAELNSTQRIVSMPERQSTGRFTLDFSLSSDGVNASGYSGGSFLSENDTTSGIRLPDHEQGIPHTPSPPSSPESVLIIENNDELSDAFLRKRGAEDAGASTKERALEDEGWITWARSPPRPIPALHGPLSLPYARCPSGAEGTIIEERDHMPRMIWGLDSEDQTTGHSKVESLPASQTDQSAAPSQSIQSRHRTAHHEPISEARPARAVLEPPTSLSRSPAVTRPSQEDTQYSEFKPPVVGISDGRYPRGAHDDTIILENLLRAETARRANQIPNYTSTDNLTRALSETLHLQELGSDFSGSRLQQQVLVDERSRYSAPYSLDANASSRANQAANAVGRPMRVSSRPAVGSALPQIFIEPRSPELSRIPPQRPSAMEIAQQYHQQQQRQNGSLLPTPPSSSSPLWSSDFSPYEDSAISPATSYMPHYSVRNTSGNPDHLRRLVYQRMNDAAYDLEGASSLAPPAQIDSSSVSQLHCDLDSSRVPSSQALMNFLTRRDIHRLSPLNSDYLLSSTGPSQTMHHTPGPMTELKAHRILSSHGYVPPSPTSPEVDRHAYSHQHQPRSIPLARLIQRRLSAVPEEDSNSTVRGRSSSPPLQMHLQAMQRSSQHAPRAYVPPQQQSMYSVGAKYSRGQGAGGLATQSRELEPFMRESYGEPAAQAKVRLPNSPVMTRGDEGITDERGRTYAGERGREDSAGSGQRGRDGSGRSRGGKRQRSHGRPRKSVAASAN
ncbi:hypothetical protein BV25DRAFT_1821030 [Artomyces pyxidatus]|uniref:Uncharacterized protein n=1 Tax=Artomyces pyxidatus TaxID=48021 RepID=A0ACB8TD34_9AGAM|nr:hypothetical protein BV25DRAFT_1821030 [Artomyces pyxidatus]